MNIELKSAKRKKIYNNLFKIIFWVLLITFLTLYFSQATGYYEYEQHQRAVLTTEKIQQFEKDVLEGKNINLEEYLETTNRNYNTNTSNAGYFLSNEIGKYVRIGIEKTFKVLNRIVEG